MAHVIRLNYDIISIKQIALKKFRMCCKSKTDLTQNKRNYSNKATVVKVWHHNEFNG